MPIALLLIGAILIVVAFNNTMGQLAAELEADIPGFFVWAIAIAAILGLGYVPGLRTPSRWLLGLVVLVIILVNYKAILSGFTTFAATGAKATNAGATPADPANALAATGTVPTAGQVAGTTAGTGTSSASSSSAAGIVGGIAGAIAGPGLGALGGGGIMSFDPSSLMGGMGFGGTGGGGGTGGFGGVDISSMSSLAMLALL